MGADLVIKGSEAVMGKKPEAPNMGKEKQKSLEEEELNPLDTGFNLGHRNGPMV